MSVKTVVIAALLGTVSVIGVSRSQQPAPRKNGGEVLPAPTLTEPAPRMPGRKEGPPDHAAHETHELSPWITYHRDGCWGGMGGTPIINELYLRSGASIPFGPFLGRILQPGWIIGGGARALFLNESLDAGWTIDAGLSTTTNGSNRPDVQIPLSVIVPVELFPGAGATPTRVNFGEGGLPGVTLDRLNRTTVNLSFGRETYLWGQAACCGASNWRWGWDVGGRYGSARADLNELRHRTDVIGGTFLAAHTDWEVPCGCCSFHGGLRAEWAYTWSDIMQRTSDVMEINLLLTFGVRY